MRRQAIIRSGLETLYFSGAHRLLRGRLAGMGAILTLHHVRPARMDAFQPNRLLEVTPEFLESVILRLRSQGIEMISLDAMHRRLTTGEMGPRFACFTLDDGYRDNLQHAYPIFRRHKVPFTIYVPTSFPEGRGELWWLAFEHAIANRDRVAVSAGGERREFICGTAEEKDAAFHALYWWLRGQDSEEAIRDAAHQLAEASGFDLAGCCAHLCMRWDELASLAADPLVTIGAHTISHLMLAKADASLAREEMRGSADAIEAALGERPRHFSYPVGDPTSAGPREFALARELGFATAVTTRPGVLFPEHREHLTALPRISLNGEFQRLRYLDVLLSGTATALWSGFNRVNAA